MEPLAYAGSWDNNSCPDDLGRLPTTAMERAFDALEGLGAEIHFVPHCQAWDRRLAGRTEGHRVELCEGWDATPVLAARVLWHEVVHVRQGTDDDTLRDDDAGRWAREIQAARQELLVRRAIGDGDEFGWRDQVATFSTTVFLQYDLHLDPQVYGPLTESLLLDSIDPKSYCR
jgi:hypothetical protein